MSKRIAVTLPLIFVLFVSLLAVSFPVGARADSLPEDSVYLVSDGFDSSIVESLLDTVVTTDNSSNFRQIMQRAFSRFPLDSYYHIPESAKLNLLL